MVASTGPGKSTILAVGETFHLKRGKDRIIFAGMLSDSIYSIVQVKASNYQGYAWNLYFPKRRQDITVDGVGLTVERVTPEEIELRLV